MVRNVTRPARDTGSHLNIFGGCLAGLIILSGIIAGLIAVDRAVRQNIDALSTPYKWFMACGTVIVVAVFAWLAVAVRRVRSRS
jgi:hypothetical protein